MDIYKKLQALYDRRSQLKSGIYISEPHKLELKRVNQEILNIRRMLKKEHSTRLSFKYH